jgi:hypothetical protein
VDFNHTREPGAVLKVWAILPRLPLVFWSSKDLEAIGKKLGVFSSLKPNWEVKADRRWAWIQVEVDLRDGLVINVDLVYGKQIWHQKVDYWCFPFRCFSCHEVGHMQSQCKRAPPIVGRLAKKWVNKSKYAQVDDSLPPLSKIKEAKEALDLEEGCLAQSTEDQAQSNVCLVSLLESILPFYFLLLMWFPKLPCPYLFSPSPHVSIPGPECHMVSPPPPHPFVIPTRAFLVFGEGAIPKAISTSSPVVNGVVLPPKK